MLTFTDEAKKRLQESLKDRDLNVYGIRLPSNDGAFFDLEWVHLGEVTVNESFSEVGGVMFIFERSVKVADQTVGGEYRHVGPNAVARAEINRN